MPTDRNVPSDVRWPVGFGRQPAHVTAIASTEEERSAIARLRHAVYADELQKSALLTAAAEPGELRDPEDERNGSYLHYVRVGDDVVGTLRSDCYPPGSAPSVFAERFSLDLLPELSDVATSEIARFVIAREFRSSRAALALGLATYRHGAIGLGCHLSADNRHTCASFLHHACQGTGGACTIGKLK